VWFAGLAPAASAFSLPRVELSKRIDRSINATAHREKTEVSFAVD
jgi:hypothetical protein